VEEHRHQADAGDKGDLEDEGEVGHSG
jgi:hypothetical protein